MTTHENNVIQPTHSQSQVLTYNNIWDTSQFYANFTMISIFSLITYSITIFKLNMEYILQYITQ